MSTPSLDTDHVRSLRSNLSELERRRRSRPLDFCHRLPWQEVTWALVGGITWDSHWGPAPSCPPHLIVIVAANRVGKSTFLGQAPAAHLTGRLRRWKRQGELWCGMPSLADSAAIQRPHVAAWLGRNEVRRWKNRDNERAEASVVSKAGWTLRFKSYDQGREHWQGGKCQAIVLDEQAPDEIVAEARTRPIDERGLFLAGFTPLSGVQSVLYREAYEPWLDYRAQHPDARWGEVLPGAWVISVGMRDNAESVGGHLPDEEIDRFEETLRSQGKHLEARVRVHGEWIDISEDRIIPVESLREWTTEPEGGFRHCVAWIDPAYTARTASCESAIAVAARDRQGRVYLLESQHGRWQPEQRQETCIEVLARYRYPNTYVQRVGGDLEFARALNNELMRRGKRACVRPWPEEGPVLDKVTRANSFAPMVAAGQVFVRPEHVGFRRQASTFSAASLRAGATCDALDAGMGALMTVLETYERPRVPMIAVGTARGTKVVRLG